MVSTVAAAVLATVLAAAVAAAVSLAEVAGGANGAAAAAVGAQQRTVKHLNAKLKKADAVPQCNVEGPVRSSEARLAPQRELATCLGEDRRHFGPHRLGCRLELRLERFGCCHLGRVCLLLPRVEECRSVQRGTWWPSQRRLVGKKARAEA